MPRYIDADALIARINEHAKSVISKCESDVIVSAIYEMAHKHIIEIIEDEFVPTKPRSRPARK